MHKWRRLLKVANVQPLWRAHAIWPARVWLWSLMKTGMKSYRVTGPTRAKPPDAEATAPCPSGNQAPSLKWAAEVEPSEFVAFRECQDLFRKRLTAPLLKTIAQLTGLRLHVLWHDPLDFQGLGARPVLCPMARQRAGAEGRRPKYCESCLRRHWKLTLRQANRGRRFIGQCGITNFCACLQVDNACPLTLVLQARVVSCSNRTCSRTMNPGVAAFRQSSTASGASLCCSDSAIVREEGQRRSAETPLRGYSSWKGDGRAGTPLPAAARTECAPYHYSSWKGRRSSAALPGR